MVSVPPTGGLSAEDDLDRTPLARQVQGLDSGRTVEAGFTSESWQGQVVLAPCHSMLLFPKKYEMWTLD